MNVPVLRERVERREKTIDHITERQNPNSRNDASPPRRRR